MAKPSPKAPLCIVIAGPNGAGKTTFAKEYLPKEIGVVPFVNADLIAVGCRRYGPSSPRSAREGWCCMSWTAWRRNGKTSLSRARWRAAAMSLG
jgi:hypothetical protein